MHDRRPVEILRVSSHGSPTLGKVSAEQRRRRVAAAALALVLLAALAGAQSLRAAATAGWRVVSYRGYVVRVPAGWPVYRLHGAAGLCVRFDRHALYLGVPSPRQSCPAAAAGRTEARSE